MKISRVVNSKLLCGYSLPLNLLPTIFASKSDRETLPMIIIRMAVKIIVAILQFWQGSLIQNGSIVKLASEF